jgi:hypothetical protein
VPANDGIFIPSGNGGTRVTFNQEITAGKETCSSTCTFAPLGITTDAVAIHLEQVSIGGHVVSGDIIVGAAEAHIRP